jgi:hypothetical protein
MVNPRRGELNLQLGTTQYKGKVTLDVLVRIESTMGCGVVKIAQRLSEGDLRISDILAILTPVIRAGGNDLDQKQIGTVIWEAGLAEGMRVAGEILALALTAGEQGNGEAASQ